MIERETRISFRSLTRDDLPQMLVWLSDPDVSPWYTAEELSADGMEAEFGEMIDGTDPAYPFMITIDGAAVGYIQCYRLGDHPDYLAQLDLAPDYVSTDLFIGDPAFRNQGWGAPVLRAFLRQIVFGQFAAIRASIMPFPTNARAIAVYERVGFKAMRVVSVFDADTGKTEDELIMLLDKTGMQPSDTLPVRDDQSPA